MMMDDDDGDDDEGDEGHCECEDVGGYVGGDCEGHGDWLSDWLIGRVSD